MNCTDSNSTKEVLSAVRGITAILCSLVSLSTVAIIVYFRLLATVLQRLYFYFSASTFVYLFIQFLMAQFTKDSQQLACAVVGFLGQWASITEIFFTFGVTSYLHVALFRGYCRQSLELRRGTQAGLECFYVAFCVFSPLTVDWVPFLHHLYGLSGAWCWIVSVDQSCADVGFLYQLTLQYIPILVLTIMTVGVLFSAYFLLHYAARRNRSDKVSRYQRDRARELLVLLVSVSVASFLIVPEVITQVLLFKGHRPAYAVRMLYAVGTPLGKLGLSAALLFYLYSLRMFTCNRLRSVTRTWLYCCRTRRTLAQPVVYVYKGILDTESVSISYGSVDNSDSKDTAAAN